MKVKYHVNRTEPIKVKGLKYRKKRPKKRGRKYQIKQVAGNVFEALFFLSCVGTLVYLILFF